MNERGLQYRRGPLQIFRAIGHPLHYRSVARAHRYKKPISTMLARYVFGMGDYPAAIEVSGPSHEFLEVELRSRFDLLTVHEIFIWECYPLPAEGGLIVDFGANAGLSMAFFLKELPNAFVIGYEPLDFNAIQAERNLKEFAGRFELRRMAVMDYDGVVEFGIEPSGRYSGAYLESTEMAQVPCVDAEEVLQDLIRSRGPISLLKVDIEGAESKVLNRITSETLSHVARIAVEGEAAPIDRLVAEGYRVSRHASGVHWFTR